MMQHTFLKMHGLGNDFVVIDGRADRQAPNPRTCRAIADRRRGVGCDQVLTLLPARDGGDVFLQIHNPDGSEAEACGNGTRCVADVLMKQAGRDAVTVETVAGALACRRTGDGRITVDMGPAALDWRDIPLARSVDTLHVRLENAPADDCCCVSLGNPHAVFFVEDADAVALEQVGPVLEHHPMFPARANIEFVSVLAPDRIRMRVWERGVGITQACGSGACAAVVAAARRGCTGRKATVVLDGGTLDIAWTGSGRVDMAGPVATSFTGQLDPALVAR